MKNRLLYLVLLVISINGFSQDLISSKNYNFAELFAEVQNETPVFLITFFKVDKNLTLLAYSSQIVFPLVEEKEMMNFSKGNRQREFKPTISFDNIYQRKPNFTIHSSYKQQAQGNHHKILKGYDFCGRAIY